MAKREKHPDRIVLEDFASQRLREIRLRLGMTQDEMAELLAFKTENSMNTKTIYRWESGIHPVPAWAYLHIEMLDKEINMDLQDKTTKKFDPYVSKFMAKVRGYLNR